MQKEADDHLHLGSGELGDEGMALARLHHHLELDIYQNGY